MSTPQPNVVIIFADDVGYGDLSCYGSTLNRSPRLDAMAREGVRFTDFYMASPVCSASRAALMTGCYPKRVGIDGVLFPGAATGLNPNLVTLPRTLKNAGYATMAVGKWHLGDQPEFLPTRHGFDAYFGLPYSNDMLPDHPRNHRFQFPPLPLVRDEQVVETDPNQASLTDRYTAEAVRFIERHAGEDRPFFLYLAHMYTHLPIHTPMKYAEASQNGVYGAAIEHLDQSTGCILDTLNRLGIDDQTLVIFTSDNGSIARDGASNAPLRGKKGTTWEGGVRVPCIARWPTRIPAGHTCRAMASSMDLLPTLAGLAHQELPEHAAPDGRDISHLLLGASSLTTPHEAFFYYGNGDQTMHAVRAGRWKLHLLRSELYDLDQDVGEQHDLFQQQPGVVRQLTELADTGRRALGDRHTGVEGEGCLPVGRAADPVTLTSTASMDPIIRAMYDLDDAHD